jgi:hypothetical protein
MHILIFSNQNVNIILFIKVIKVKTLYYFSNTICKITAGVGETAAITNRDLDFSTYPVTILMLFI